MEVKITIDDNYKNKETELKFTNEHLDNDSFVDMIIESKLYTVPIDDLYSAITAFKESRTERLIKEKLME